MPDLPNAIAWSIFGYRPMFRWSGSYRTSFSPVACSLQWTDVVVVVVLDWPLLWPPLTKRCDISYHSGGLSVVCTPAALVEDGREESSSMIFSRSRSSSSCQMDAGWRTAPSSSRTTLPKSSGCSPKMRTRKPCLEMLFEPMTATKSIRTSIPESCPCLALFDSHGKRHGCCISHRPGPPVVCHPHSGPSSARGRDHNRIEFSSLNSVLKFFLTLSLLRSCASERTMSSISICI